MGLDQGNLLKGAYLLTRKPLEDREFQFVYICSLFGKTQFIGKQNGSKLQ